MRSLKGYLVCPRKRLPTRLPLRDLPGCELVSFSQRLACVEDRILRQLNSFVQRMFLLLRLVLTGYLC